VTTESPFCIIKLMERYQILPHPADLKIKVFGKDKKELFLNALFALGQNQKPEIEKPEKKVKRKIKIESPDISALLVDFLSEVLYLSQTKKEVYFGANFKKFSDQKLEAEIFGKKVERFGEDIKAVTYHGLEIAKKDNLWEATILFDI